jgi:hypothetical protein
VRHRCIRPMASAWLPLGEGEALQEIGCNGRLSILASDTPVLYTVLGPNSGTQLGQKFKSFPPCYSESTLLKKFNPLPLGQKWFETGL